MLYDFLGIEKTNPAQTNDNGVIGAQLINILAGADKTGVL